MASPMKNFRTIPLTNVVAVRLVCRHCSAASILPLTARDGPTKCFNCYADLPGREVVRELVRNLGWTRFPETVDISLEVMGEAAA